MLLLYNASHGRLPVVLPFSKLNVIFSPIPMSAIQIGDRW